MNPSPCSTASQTDPVNITPQADALFTLGRLLSTPEALRRLSDHGIALPALLQRHAKGDWGDVVPADARANDEALRHGGRLLSSYTLAPERKVWILTEANRSATTLLLPEEY